MIGGIGKKLVTRDELDTILRDLLRRIGQAGFATGGGGGGSGGGADVPSPSARGDMLRATSAPAWERFAIGAINTILKSDGNDSLWTDEPILKSLTLSDLIASRPVITDAAKKLVSIDYTGAVSLRKNLGLEPSDSPTLTNLTLSGLTISQPMVTDASKKLISQSYADFRSNLNLTHPFEIDINGGLMPIEGDFGITDNWELDVNGNLQPVST